MPRHPRCGRLRHGIRRLEALARDGNARPGVQRGLEAALRRLAGHEPEGRGARHRPGRDDRVRGGLRARRMAARSCAHVAWTAGGRRARTVAHARHARRADHPRGAQPEPWRGRTAVDPGLRADPGRRGMVRRGEPCGVAMPRRCWDGRIRRGNRGDRGLRRPVIAAAIRRATGRVAGWDRWTRLTAAVLAVLALYVLIVFGDYGLSWD